MTSIVTSHFHYILCIVLLMVGLYTIIATHHLLKKLIGIALFQVAISLFYISVGKVAGGTAPILDDRFILYSNPLPHVLILTAIVVGVATISVGLALVVRIHHAYQSLDEPEILRKDGKRQ